MDIGTSILDFLTIFEKTQNEHYLMENPQDTELLTAVTELKNQLRAVQNVLETKPRTKYLDKVSEMVLTYMYATDFRNYKLRTAIKRNLIDNGVLEETLKLAKKHPVDFPEDYMIERVNIIRKYYQ